MSYNLKNKKKRNEKYYSELEIQELRHKYKGHLPPATEVSRVATRRFLRVESLVHRKGHVVQYKDGLAVVRKSNKKGLTLEPFKAGKDQIAVPSGKTVFVPQRKVEHEVYPITFPQLSIGTVAPYNMATLDE